MFFLACDNHTHCSGEKHDTAPRRKLHNAADRDTEKKHVERKQSLFLVFH